MWNLSLGKDIDHVNLTVKYTLIPNTEIHYEILEGKFGKGTKNSIMLKDLGIKTYILANLVPAEILSKVYGTEVRIFQDFIHYFVTQDSIHLEDKFKELFRVGQTCNKCNLGRLQYHSKREKTEWASEYRKGEFFLCDNCGEEFSNFVIGLSEKIGIRDDVKVVESKEDLKN